MTTIHTLPIKLLVRNGALAGMLSISSYLTVAFLELPGPLTFLLAMLFPMLGIASLFSLREYLNRHTPTYTNQLSFIFGAFAFTICAIFLSAQLAVQMEVNAASAPGQESLVKLIRESIRVVDMGMDVAWDMFIGTSLLLFAFSANKLPALKWWGWTGGILGVALMVLNVYTFPIPPADKGLFDLGPFIALYLFVLHARMFFLSRNLPAQLPHPRPLQ